MSSCIAVKINQQDFPLKPSITYSGGIIMAKNDLYTGIINYPFIQSIIHTNHCIKIRTSTGNLVQVRYRMRFSQNRICRFGSIVSVPGNQYLSLKFKVKQTVSCSNPNGCINDTLLCCANWECG